MQFNNPFEFDRRLDRKEISILVFLVFLPNVLGMLNYDTGMGFKLHVFQLGIVLAALFYGWYGGLMAGIFGSIYSAVIMNNPYIIIGNAILGLVAGYLIHKGYHTNLAIWVAFAIQIPWLIFSDYVFIGMPMNVIWMIIIALAVSNTIWAALGHYAVRPHVKALQ